MPSAGFDTLRGDADSQVAHAVDKKAKIQNYRGNSCSLQLTANGSRLLQSYKHSIMETLRRHSLHSMVVKSQSHNCPAQ